MASHTLQQFKPAAHFRSRGHNRPRIGFFDWVDGNDSRIGYWLFICGRLARQVLGYSPDHFRLGRYIGYSIKLANTLWRLLYLMYILYLPNLLRRRLQRLLRLRHLRHYRVVRKWLV
jgi:hypothetical protein